VGEGNANIEVSSHLREHGSGGEGSARAEVLEILEAILLAVVAVATALSGYQAARFDGISGRDYATASRYRVQSEQTSLTSNQTTIYNSGTLTAWLQAEVAHNTKLADLLARRFTPNYEAAFRIWLTMHPLTNPAAPPGPRYIPQYKDPLVVVANALSAKSTEAYDHGVESRDHADDYVRLTVILAAVLFLIAIGQRFRIRGVRLGVLGIAGALIVYAMVLLAIYPRA
jgi:hypothetical protein